MIKIGNEIPLVNAASKKKWYLKIIGKSFECYQYFPASVPPVTQVQLNSTNINTAFSNLQAAMPSIPPYFKLEKDPNDNNSCSQRIVSFVVTQEGYDESFVANSNRRNDSLKLFVFPYPVVNQIRKFKKKIHNYDWKIFKVGHGTGTATRYKVDILDPVALDESTLKIINGAIEDISIKDVIIDKKIIYITQKFTPYNRFEIMDI